MAGSKGFLGVSLEEEAMYCKRKIFMTLGFLLAIPLCAIPVMASNVDINMRESGTADPTVTFHTLTNVPMEEPRILTVLADDQLGAIVGAGSFKRLFFRMARTAPINIGINISVTPQINVCGVCIGVTQTNSFRGLQRITFR